jgi:hypothetical protein
MRNFSRGGHVDAPSDPFRRPSGVPLLRHVRSEPARRVSARASAVTRRTVRLASLFGSLLLVLGPLGAIPATAVDVPVMEAAAMLQGHARIGSWMAIRVHLRNDGPAVVGELRLAGGAQGRTQFGTLVDLPTNSAKDYVLYVQPPAFARAFDVSLVADGHVVATKQVTFTVHDATQLIVGVVAEQPQRIVPELDLLPAPSGQSAAIVQLSPADLPDRVEAWGALDRIVWQDVDSQMTRGQVAALRGWLAGGGRLVIAGGTAGPAVLAGFPDDILPYRPTATVDVAPASLTGLVGGPVETANDVPALGGTLSRGHALAASGDRVVAAEANYGTGAVTLLGFDPSTGWIAASSSSQALWRRFLPQRSSIAAIADDGLMVNAVSQLPALALPPIGGLLAMLLGYILLIGPINYLVLRKLDRREWAWITMPILIAVFAAGAYAFGASLRGLDVILNEVAIVRGAPDATEGTAQVYLGVFSPSRGTYQLDIPGGALVSSTLSGDITGDTSALDVLQGDPSHIRNLTVGFGSLRTVRAETAAVVPRIQADLSLVDGTLRGTIHNLSDQTLERPAVVLGSSVVVLSDLAPNGQQTLSLPIRSNPGPSLSDRIVGQTFFGDPGISSEATQQAQVRHSMIDQLTFDPTVQASTQLQADSPVLLAWGSRRVLDVRVSGQVPRRTGNVLFFIPLLMRVQGSTVFEGDLLRSSVVSVDGGIFNKDPFALNMGRGTVTMAYRPITFDGALTPRRLTFGLTLGGGDVGNLGGAKSIEPMNPQPCRKVAEDLPGCIKPLPVPACDPATQDCNLIVGFPEIEVFDRTLGGRWLRLPQFTPGASYELKDAARYVDPGSGTVLVRFVNDKVDNMGFGFQVRLEGDVR